MELDLDEFRRAVKLYRKATRKSVPEILNHAATQAAFRGQQARFTPKAKKTWPLNKPPVLKPGDGKKKRGKRGFGKNGSKTEAPVLKPGDGKKKRGKRGFGKNGSKTKAPVLKFGDGKKKRGKRGFGKKGSKTKAQYRDSLWFALGQKSKHASDGALAAATKVYNSRVRSVAFIRANWGAVVGKLGIQRNTRFVKRPDIEVKKATLMRPLVEFFNAKLEGKGAAAAYSNLNPGFQAALNDAIWGPRGMVPYAQKKLEKNWRRH
ncbi:MAG: hypothetical protein ACO3LT_09345 [Ilumatobacteraceae bacterium]